MKPISLSSLSGELSNDKLRAQLLLRNLKSFESKTDNQIKLYNDIDDNIITFAYGPAGTGKTHVLLHKALTLLKASDTNIAKIYICKTLVGLESIGALPGGIEDKINPYNESVTALLADLVGEDTAVALIAEGFVQLKPVCFIRGVTLKNAAVIVDEAQNLTKHQILSVLTRIGDDSKYLITGDIEQTDIRLQKGEKCGLQECVDRLQNIAEISFTKFTDEDSVRHPIIKFIVKAFR